MGRVVMAVLGSANLSENVPSKHLLAGSFKLVELVEQVFYLSFLQGGQGLGLG